MKYILNAIWLEAAYHSSMVELYGSRVSRKDWLSYWLAKTKASDNYEKYKRGMSSLDAPTNN